MGKLYTTLLLFVFVFNLSAQHLEIGFTLGGSNYLGDLAPSRFWTSLGETNVHTGIFGKYNLNDRLAFRASLNYGRIGADDSRSITADNFRLHRNLNFRSDITEVALTTEFNLFRFVPLHLKSRFSPYVSIGIGFFKFNPKASYQGEWYDLQPMGTEGQGLPNSPKKYRLIQPSVPLAAGFKYALTENLNVSFEYGMRKTFTDYLDDTSRNYPDLERLKQENGEMACKLSWRTDEITPDAKPPEPGSGRGDPTDMDWYIFAGFSISYNFIHGNLYQPPKMAGKVKCPRVRKKKGVLGGLLIR